MYHDGQTLGQEPFAALGDPQDSLQGVPRIQYAYSKKEGENGSFFSFLQREGR